MESISLTKSNTTKDLGTKEVKKKKTKEQLESELKGYDRIIGYSGIMLTLILPMIHNEIIDKPEDSSTFVILLLLTGIYILFIFIYYYLRRKDDQKLIALNLAGLLSMYSPLVFVSDLAIITFTQTPSYDLPVLIIFCLSICGIVVVATYYGYKRTQNNYEN